MARAPCPVDHRARAHDIRRSKTREGKSQSEGSTAVPFQEVISEATAVVDGGREIGAGRIGKPRKRAKEMEWLFDRRS